MYFSVKSKFKSRPQSTGPATPKQAFKLPKLILINLAFDQALRREQCVPRRFGEKSAGL